jgi:hypothetical protein
MRCFYEIQAVAALTTVKIVELLFDWGKRLPPDTLKRRARCRVFLRALQAGHMDATILIKTLSAAAPISRRIPGWQTRTCHSAA